MAVAEALTGTGSSSRAGLGLRTATMGALLVAFTRPASWPVALAGFLARGGVVGLALPILVLPSPSGLENVLGGPASALVLGALPLALVALIAGVVALGVLAIVGGALVGGWSERQGVAIAIRVAAEEDLLGGEARVADAPGQLSRIVAVRLLGLVPPGLALIAAARPVYDAVYHELILPAELRTHLLVRIVDDIPGPLALITAAWILGDAAAAIGVRRIVLDDAGAGRAWLDGWLTLVRSPIRVLGIAVVTLGGLLVLVGPSLVAAGIGWSRLRGLLVDLGEPALALTGSVLFVAAWLGGLVLAGAASAFRGAAWTFVSLRGPGPSSPPR